jgi:hypothetical protein
MNADKNYYQVLGINPKASADEIKKAYKKLARKYHPDLNPRRKSAEERFKRVQEAYEVLSDPVSRQEYDQSGGNSTFNGRQARYPGDSSYSATPARSRSETLNYWKAKFTVEFTRQRKVAVFIWGLCLVGIFLPTSSISLWGHFYETSMGLRLLWISLPLAMIWVGSEWSSEGDSDTSLGPVIKQGFGILMVAAGWLSFVRLVSRRFLGPLIYELFGRP